jgi:hypothetical protein
MILFYERGILVGKRTLQNLDFLKNGVAISPASPIVGDKIKILYDGILSKNGATELTVHVGYGSNWDSERDVPMVKKETCFETTIPALKEDYLKISFKDTSNNIDDNSGNGYSFDIMG